MQDESKVSSFSFCCLKLKIQYRKLRAMNLTRRSVELEPSNLTVMKKMKNKLQLQQLNKLKRIKKKNNQKPRR